MLKTVDYSIEYSHIYFGSEPLIPKENIRSIELTKELLSILKRRHKTYSLAVLIDTSIRGGYNPDEIYKELKGRGLAPDFIVNESIFFDTADDLVLEIPFKNKVTSGENLFFVEELKRSKIKIKLVEKRRGTDYYICPLVFAIW